jgi:hypothetical protein
MIRIIPVPLGMRANMVSERISKAVDKAKTAGFAQNANVHISYQVAIAVNGLSAEDADRLLDEHVLPAVSSRKASK